MEQFTEETLRVYNGQNDYNAYREAVLHAAETVLPKKRKSVKECPWDNDPEVARARKQLMDAHRMYPTEDHTQYERNLEDTYVRRMEEIIHDTAEEINRNHEAGRTCAVWRQIDVLTGRKSRPRSIIASSSIEDRLTQVENYFSNLLNFHSPHVDLPRPVNIPDAPEVSTEPISLAELQLACRSMPTGKAAGPDNLPSDIV